MAHETMIPQKERKGRLQLPGLGTPADSKIRIVKIPMKDDPLPEKKDFPLSTWTMPPQPDGYLKSTHKDCL